MANNMDKMYDQLPDKVKKLVEEYAKTYVKPEVKPKVYGEDSEIVRKFQTVGGLAELERQRDMRKKYIDEAKAIDAELAKNRVTISNQEREAYAKADANRANRRKEILEVGEPELQVIEEPELSIVDELSELVRKEKKDGIWDFGVEDKIPFFDINLSYELSGYRPINETEGLDFNPEDFIQTRRHYEKTGKFTLESNSRAYDDFWIEEYTRLNDGLEINGYRITGDHYFFLNYYQLPNTDKIQYAGQGRTSGFADFYVAQYEYFHYVELCKQLRKNSISLKGRGLGWSEIAAAIVANTYLRRPETRGVVAAYTDFYLDKTLNKVWTQFNFCNAKTNGGLFKPLGLDQPRKKRSYVEERVTRVEKGWLSEVEGIVADKPNKVRGDRTDVLFFEEFGSFPNSIKAYIQGDALVHVNGVKVGIKLGFGTGGDSGPALEGLSKIFYNPIPYDVLPMRHNFTKTGETTLTGYFVPSFRIVVKDEDTGKRLMDHRGYTKIQDGIDYYTARRNKFSSDPEGYLIYCAEYCFTPEDALVLEGDNQFNRVLLVDQLTEIKQFGRSPKIEKGLLEYDFKNRPHQEENIQGFKFLQSNTSKLQILEHPIRDESGNPFRNLYVAGIDAIDMGKQDTSEATRDPSDFCIVIKRRQHGLKPPTYVAIYKDRPRDIREAYKVALRLCEYYNCQANIERTKISLRAYFQERNKAGKYLMRQPRATLTDSQGGVSKIFGTPATPQVIQHQLDLIAQYVEDYSTEIWFENMLDELIHYSFANKGKYDIVAAMGMAELADEELQGFVPKSEQALNKEWQDFGYYTDPNTGYKRYGVIPNQVNITVKATINPYIDDGRPRSSDPRKYNYYNPYE